MILKKLKPMPKDFLWGASTSAYQVEGANLTHGKGPSVQDIKKVPEGTSELDVCADFYHHYKEDIAFMAEMGFKTFRFSVAWSRILPEGTGAVNQEGIDFYNNVIDECLKYNIVPFIIEDNLKMYYYRGLKEWDNEKGYLRDTCLTAQDRYKQYLDYFEIKY